jgi:hypothetical protein
MNVEIGTEAAQFPEKEYINGISLAVKYGRAILIIKRYEILRSSRVAIHLTVNAKVQQSNSPGFYLSILRHSRIRGTTDEAMLNKILMYKSKKSIPLNSYINLVLKSQSILYLTGCQSTLR